MENILIKIWSMNIVKSLIALIICFIVYKIFKSIIDKCIKKGLEHNKFDGKKEIYIKLLNNILKYIFIILITIIILKINGINVTSLLAGLGIAGIVVGLALQDALKDIIMGANIITDNYFMIGDVVKYNGYEGKVISFGLKTTKIKDIYTNDVISITNRNIDKIVNVSDWLDINFPVSYNDKIENVEKVLNEASEKIKLYKNVKNCKYLGINELADSSMIYKLRIYCIPEFKPQIKRDCIRCVKILFDENNITIPYTQIDIHNI